MEYLDEDAIFGSQEELAPTQVKYAIFGSQEELAPTQVGRHLKEAGK